MVEKYLGVHEFSTVDFLKNHFEADFYFTENNMRKFIADVMTWKKLLKESKFVYVCEERGDILGVILLWRSVGNGIERWYVKLNCLNERIAQKLITVLIWNSDKQEIFAKISKDSKLMKSFRDKGFEFRGDRGKELLLCFFNRTRKNVTNLPNQQNTSLN